MARIVRWCGRGLCVAGLGAWVWWLGWRITAPLGGLVGVSELALELLAAAAAMALTVGLWRAAPPVSLPSPASELGGSRLLPERLAVRRGLHVSPSSLHGVDDTGEIALARRAFVALDLRRRAARRGGSTEFACAVLAVDGIRRLGFVVALVGVLLSGRFPFPVPSATLVATLLGSQVLLVLGLWALSDGVIRPGDRLRWSMASIGAGLGDGRSRSGLPIRWATTMAAIVVLNLAVALRGVSDRWTHGLGALGHDERIIAMTASGWLVVAGFAALRTLPQPDLDLSGATRRVEEASTRRLALGGTLAVAVLGFVAGVMPGAAPL